MVLDELELDANRLVMMNELFEVVISRTEKRLHSIKITLKILVKTSGGISIFTNFGHKMQKFLLFLFVLTLHLARSNLVILPNRLNQFYWASSCQDGLVATSLCSSLFFFQRPVIRDMLYEQQNFTLLSSVIM